MATHPSILAWRIPWTEEPGGLQSKGVSKSPIRLNNFTSLHFTSLQSLQSCLTLCDPMGCSLSGSAVHVISQARIQEWVAMPVSRRSSPLWI